MTASDPQVTTREEWLIARRELLAQEKELTRHRVRVNAVRRALPMVEITKNYVFDGQDGRTGLVDLFDGRSQLLIYHFMFEPDADEGCPSCSFTMDNVGNLRHLYARDTSTRRSHRSNTTTRTRPISCGWTTHGRAGAAKSTASVLSSARVSTSSTPTPVTRAPPRFSSAPTTGSTSPARGRQEDWEPEPRRGDDPFMGWLRRHDEYEPDAISGAKIPD